MFIDLEGEALYILNYDKWLMEIDNITSDSDALSYNHNIAFSDIKNDIIFALKLDSNSNIDAILDNIYVKYKDTVLKRAISIKQLIYGFSQHINGENYAFEQVQRLENEYKRYQKMFNSLDYNSVSDTQTARVWL